MTKTSSLFSEFETYVLSERETGHIFSINMDDNSNYGYNTAMIKQF